METFLSDGALISGKPHDYKKKSTGQHMHGGFLLQAADLMPVLDFLGAGSGY